MHCHIQIFLEGNWKTAAVFEPDPGTLERGVDDDIIQRLARWIDEVAAGLFEARPAASH